MTAAPKGFERKREAFEIGYAGDGKERAKRGGGAMFVLRYGHSSAAPKGSAAAGSRGADSVYLPGLRRYLYSSDGRGRQLA